MKKKNQLCLILFMCLSAAKCFGFEVWMGTHLSTHSMAITPQDWALTAAKLEGINVNRAPHDTDPATTADWQSMLARYTNARSKMVEMARSEPTKNPALVDELAFPAIAAELAQKFQEARNYNFVITHLMFYDENGTYQGVEYLYQWTNTEVQYMRDWLDANGYSSVLLMWNVRNNSVRNQQFAANPLVDMVEIEASTTALLNNTNNQITFFQWFWTNPATASKPIALQIPRTLDSITQYAGTRRVAQLLGTLIGYGDNGMRSSRLIFMPVTYNDNYAYLPEINSATSYKNTLTSICLSLIEQRTLFEGRLSTLPTVAHADSLSRNLSPTINGIADQVLVQNAGTGPLAFTVADDQTAATALTLSAASSNTALVPVTNIVFGGSGANRTVTVTPATGQSGTASITVTVSDGFWIGTATLSVTVLPAGVVPGTLYSQLADASPRSDGVVLSSTVTELQGYIGRGGTSPGLDRSPVYVFQLPNLGATANPFVAASFSMDYAGPNNGTPVTASVDLYGLGRRASPTVLGGDYYGETSTADPTDATRLQANFLTTSTTSGVTTTTVSGGSALLAYLNAQYASGAGAGQYVFLRLNSRAAMANTVRYQITMADGADPGPPDTRPRISYQANSIQGPTISAISNQTVPVNTSTDALPFTIGDDTGQVSALTVTRSSSNLTLVPAANVVLGGSGENRTVTVTPASNQSGTST
ncbi:MAG: hypothetical protein KDK97_16770, partial [Verrucomicrobiales bacterium]|nr:hypothetical protein [Verrucomicrobiales bacterium]